METNHLFYKIHKGTITARDYINWSHTLLSEGTSSPSLKIISSFSPLDNLFEIESYFKRSSEELGTKQPSFETCARAHIDFLASQIIEVDDYRQIYHLTDRIFKVAVAELNSPDDLLHWLHLYELMDRVDYHYDKEVVSEIKHEARSTSDLGHLSRSRHKKNDSNF